MCNEVRTGSGLWQTGNPLISHKYMKKNAIIHPDNNTFVDNVSNICTLFNNYFINVISDFGSDNLLLCGDNALSCVIAHDNQTYIECIKSMHNILPNEFNYRIVDVSMVNSHIFELNSKKIQNKICFQANYSRLAQTFYAILFVIY